MRSHLIRDEIELLFFSGFAVASPIPEMELAEARRHWEGCPDCQEVVRRHEASASQLAQLAQPALPSGEAGPHCPPEPVWAGVVAGTASRSEEEAWMLHAAQCSHCGPRLREAVRSAADTLTPDEEALVLQLRTSQPDWQADFARTLAATPHASERPGWKNWLSVPRLTLAGSLAAALAVGGWFAFRQWQTNDVDHLLAQAAVERRVTEGRLQGADFAEMRQDRGGAVPTPQSLLEAEARIGRELLQHPDDPHWLQARAQAAMLEGKWDESLHDLQEALASQPDSLELLRDLGTAYYQRGLTTKNSADIAQSMDLFGKVLGKSPDDPIALFNRAIAAEELREYQQEIDDLEHYLRLDSSSGWAKEARARLARIKNRVKEKQEGLVRPLMSPPTLISKASSEDAESELESRVEAYDHAALSNWLPVAYPVVTVAAPSDGSQGSVRQALKLLASVGEVRHGDRWLGDLLEHSRDKRFPQAVTALAEAVRADDHGDYAAGRAHARAAASWFATDGNLAGKLRSSEEMIYAEGLLWQNCESPAAALDLELADSGYAWLVAQTKLELYNCSGVNGRDSRMKGLLDAARKQAESHGYPSLGLRALYFQAEELADSGDSTTGVELAEEGLATFWNSQVDLMQGYNLYSSLDTAAETMQLRHFQLAVWRDATALIDMHPDILLRAMAHSWYCKAAYSAHDEVTARRELDAASALFASAPKSQSTVRDWVDAEIWLARQEAQEGDYERASARLKQVWPDLKRENGYEPQMNYYSTLARVGASQVDSVSAENAVRAAVFLAEWKLRTINTPKARQLWAEQSAGAYLAAVQRRLAQGDTQGALELWEWFRGAAFRAGERGRPSADAVPDVRRAPALPLLTEISEAAHPMDHETVLSYATLPDGVVVWEFDDRGVNFRRIQEPVNSVRDKALAFHRLCETRSSSLVAVQTAAKALYRALIAPVEDRLDSARTLVVEQDETTAPIPFEALMDAQGRYLAQRIVVRESPGVYFARHARPSRAITEASPALVVSVHAPAEKGVMPLADAAAEADSVAAHFSGSRRLEDAQATLAAVRSQMHGQQVFHFAGHAVASPKRTGLLLGESEPSRGRAKLLDASSLRAADFADLQLAVLSACDTQPLPTTELAGTESLTDTFLRGGVPNVVASRWQVDSTQTAELMRQFYQQLAGGQRPAAALHSAQVAMAARPQAAHPFYWAAFAVQGVN